MGGEQIFIMYVDIMYRTNCLVSDKHNVTKGQHFACHVQYRKRDVEAHLAQLRQEGNHEEEGAAGEACPLPADALLSAASRQPRW